MKYTFFSLSLLLAYNLGTTCNTLPHASLQWGLSARQGDRPSMEDAHTHELSLNGDSHKAFFAVYDGHGGQQAAEIAAEVLHNNIELCKGNLEQAFLITDEQVMQKTNSGTCAAAAYIHQNTLTIGWVGDSRVVVVRDGKMHYATQDHKPNSPHEQQRIENAGGRVEFFGVPRINGLAVSRALGDKNSKQKNSGAIIARPEIHNETLHNNDLIIIACDGIWDVISNQEAATIVSNALSQPEITLKQKYPQPPLMKNSNLHEQHTQETGDNHLLLIARALRDTAYTKGSTDNLSVIVIAVRIYDTQPN